MCYTVCEGVVWLGRKLFWVLLWGVKWCGVKWCGVKWFGVAKW